MKNGFKRAVLAGLAATAWALPATKAAVGPTDGQNTLVDILVEEGVLTQDEAARAKDKLAQSYAASPASKIGLSSFLSKLRLYGDARLRYQYQNAQSYAGTTAVVNNNDRNRYRYRLRLGADYIYDKNWSAGVRLETGEASNSANADFGRYFDKVGGSVNVGLVYLEYQNKFSPFESTRSVGEGKDEQIVVDPGVTVGVDVRAGKHIRQVLLSDAFFYSEINPEGLSEEISFDNVGAEGLSFALRGGEYLASVARTDQTATSPAGTGQDGLLYMAQVEGKYAFAKDANVRIAPIFIGETTSSFGNQEGSSSSATGINATVSGATPTAGQAYIVPIVGSNPYNYLGNLAVIAVPLEVNWKAWNLPHKIWGTYGANLDGNQRLHDLGITSSGNNTFWNVGYQIGDNKVKGDWSASAEWRWLEAGSYTTNLSDTNWANNGLNQQGFVLRSGYNFTDFLIAQVSYYHSNPIDSSRALGSPNNPTTGPNGLGSEPYVGSSNPFYHQVDVVQVDLSWKF